MTGWASLKTPARSIAGRRSRRRLFELFADEDGPLVIVRSGSAIWADKAFDRLVSGGREVHVVPSRGEPSLPDLERALAELKGLGLVGVIAIGGGSVIDMGKALAALAPARGTPLDHLEVVGKGLPLEADPLPFVALPTTAGTGAEATKNAVIAVPEHARKVSLRDDRMIPQVAILDPALTDGLAWPVTLATGMDAITQLIEPYLCRHANTATDALCLAAIEPAMRALIRLSKGEDQSARHTMLLAAHFSGIALANAGLGAVHGLAGVIGGRTGAAHGAICARLLPEVLEANRKACDTAGIDTARFDAVDSMISAAFGQPGRAADLIRGFLADQPLPSLDGGNAKALDADAIARDAAQSSSMKPNPVELSPDVLAQVVERAR